MNVTPTSAGTTASLDAARPTARRRRHLDIRSADDLAEARRLNSWLTRLPLRGITIEAAGLRPDDARRLEKRLRRLFNDCGCAQTGLAFLAAMAVFGNVFDLFTAFTWTTLAMVLPAAAIIALLVKIAVLFVSHRRLDRLLRDLREYYPTTTEPEK